jgi:hypothetical protein
MIMEKMRINGCFLGGREKEDDNDEGGLEITGQVKCHQFYKNKQKSREEGAMGDINMKIYKCMADEIKKREKT